MKNRSAGVTALIWLGYLVLFLFGYVIYLELIEPNLTSKSLLVFGIVLLINILFQINKSLLRIAYLADYIRTGNVDVAGEHAFGKTRLRNIDQLFDKD